MPGKAANSLTTGDQEIAYVFARKKNQSGYF
jgi:hypothetical protein